MNPALKPLWAFLVLLPGLWTGTLKSEIVAEMTSAYHQIQVVDEGGFRMLSFDGSMESRISLANPLQGHYEYTEYFHMPWLWNTQISRVLMVGLGGGTTQRTYEHFYPQVQVETVELDSYVVALARQYFHFNTSPRQKVHVGDGRQFLRRSRNTYDVILMDAYSHNRYGTFLPHHLATKEFFELATNRLSARGVLCYNVMGTVNGAQANLVAALYKTMQSVFPKVYLFPAIKSDNVMLLATKDKTDVSISTLHQRASLVVRQGVVKVPKFRDRVYVFRRQPPPASLSAPVLTDDYSPLEGMMGVQRGAGEKGSDGDKVSDGQ
jgi:spermidine synthase